MSAVVAGSVTGIDMNSDMGESFGRWKLGDDEALLDVVSSANVACGFHAGDPSVMLRTLSYAASREVMVGAHVAYRDLAGFGRRYVDESPDELKADVMYQIAALEGMARSVGAQVRYVKPHGALYNRIVRDESQAAAVVDAIRAVDASLAILTQPPPWSAAWPRRPGFVCSTRRSPTARTTRTARWCRAACRMQ